MERSAALKLVGRRIFRVNDPLQKERGLREKPSGIRNEGAIMFVGKV